MVDPRVFVSFDFDHNETEKNIIYWSIEKFKKRHFLFKTGLRSRLCLSHNGRLLLKKRSIYVIY
jgi:hypothetical protein